MMAASMLSSSSVRRFWKDRNAIMLEPQASYAQLLHRETLPTYAFVKAVQSRMQPQYGGNPLDHPPQMRGLLDGKRNARPAPTVAVSEPFLDDRIAAKLVAPHTLRHMAEVNGVIDVQVP